RFHLRFRIPADAREADRPLALEFHWPLRPDSSFVLRLQLRDEGGSARGSVVRGFRVPLQVTPRAAGLTGASGAPALPEELPQERLAGADDLRVVPPADEVILTHWRAEALVSGSRIQRVDFYVDGQLQMRRTAAPLSADLK